MAICVYVIIEKVKKNRLDILLKYQQNENIALYSKTQENVYFVALDIDIQEKRLFVKLGVDFTYFLRPSVGFRFAVFRKCLFNIREPQATPASIPCVAYI